MSEGNFATDFLIKSDAIGAVKEIPQLVWYNRLSIKGFGAVADGDADNTANGTNNKAAIDVALDAAALTGRPLVIPKGVYLYSGAPHAAFTGPVTIIGEGNRDECIIVFKPSGATQHFISFDGAAGGHIEGFTIRHWGARATASVGSTVFGANGHCINISESSDVTVHNMHLEWGSVGVTVTQSEGITVTKNKIHRTAGYGININKSIRVWALENDISWTSSDGIKVNGGAANQCKRIFLINNYIEEAGRDGIDTYDGLWQSLIAGNAAYRCHLQGYEHKGTPVSNEYMDFEFTVANNQAIECGRNFDDDEDYIPSYSFASARSFTAIGNSAIRGYGSGFQINNCQEFTWTSNNAFRCREHGLITLGSIRHGILSACAFGDCGYDDGSGDATNFAGMFLSGDVSGCQFIGMRAYQGGTTNAQGGARYGMDVVETVSGNLFSGCYFVGVTSAIANSQSADTGWVGRNTWEKTYLQSSWQAPT